MTVSLYALVDHGDAVDLGEGVAGEPVTVVVCGGLRAAVGMIDGSVPLTAQTARQHDAVVRRLAERFASVLPARFGSLADSEDALGETLRSRHAAYETALSLVKDREQMTLRVFHHGPPGSPGVESSVSPPAADGHPGTAYLALRARAYDAFVPGLDEVREALRPLVAEERRTVHRTAPLAVTLYHLVGRGRSEDYRRALASAPRAHGVTLAASGPWPPYAFAPEAGA